LAENAVVGLAAIVFIYVPIGFVVIKVVEEISVFSEVEFHLLNFAEVLSKSQDDTFDLFDVENFMRQLVTAGWVWCPWVCQVKKVRMELLAITSEIARYSMLKVSWSSVWLWLGSSDTILPV
jgi:hypothetical protein